MWFMFPGDRLRLKIQVDGCVVMRCFELVDMDVSGGENVWFDLSAAFNPEVFQSPKINNNIYTNIIVNVNTIKNKCNIKEI